MKYWKNGFSDTPQEGASEITEEYYLELLNGQSSGKRIVQDEKGYPVLLNYEQSFSDLINLKVAEIQEYDKSDVVNSFTLKGMTMWLDKATRVGLLNSIKVEQANGKEQTTLWYGVNKLLIPVDDALNMLNVLELYALRSYNVTQSHIAKVTKLTTKEEIELYDFTVGYPEKIRF